MRRPVVWTVLAGLALAGCGGATEDVGAPTVVSLTAAPVEVARDDALRAAARGPSVDATPSPSPTDTVGAKTAADRTDTADEPTDATPAAPPPATPVGPSDAVTARFAKDTAGALGSDAEHVAVDLDGDDIDELVFTWIDDGRAQLAVAWWNPADGYRILARGSGGSANHVDRLQVRQLNGTGGVELLTFQSSQGNASLSVWTVAGVGKLPPLLAVGGCADGNHTFGAVGARIEDPDGDGVSDIVATCDESPLPVKEWSEQRYTWTDGAYRAVEPDAPGRSGEAPGQQGKDGGEAGPGQGG